MEKLRLFIAIELSPSVINQIAVVQNELKKSNYNIKWVKPENLHLTLRFLGNVNISLILSSLTKHLEDIIGKTLPFEITFGQIGVFPNLRSPRVLWVGTLKGGEEVICLAEKINKLLESQFNFSADKNPFSPHLTFGRVKTLKDKERLVEQLNGFKDIKLDNLLVKYVSLFQSELKREGPVYSNLKKFALGIK